MVTSGLRFVPGLRQTLGALFEQPRERAIAFGASQGFGWHRERYLLAPHRDFRDMNVALAGLSNSENFG